MDAVRQGEHRWLEVHSYHPKYLFFDCHRRPIQVYKFRYLCKNKILPKSLPRIFASFNML